MATKTVAKTVSKKVSAKKVATVSTKTLAKKATAKKVVKKTPTFKAMVCAIDGECFWTKDGRILQDLADLHMAFGSMDEEVFLHHVHDEKNDFADWVEHVLTDLDCSVALRKTIKKDTAHKVVATHLKKYTTQ